ncbi:hypothetical protein ACHAW5_002564 [Stephanodiscus triporus]|uniref:Uncharacterized protein n=1 Tax=Stephanodiscus triporus TaxID=2934178 RepID=A0ABD3MQL8_9STRA
MDRAAFLRSLNFLRPLPPGVWDSSVASVDGKDDDEGAYSGSTIAPPTPSRDDNALLVLEGLPCVVSIEPTARYDNRFDDDGGNDRRDDASRKRVRGDDYSPDVVASGPAFFKRLPVVTDADGGETDWNYQVNSDPSLCTFEAAIVKKFSSGSALEEVRGGVLSTRDRYRQADEHDTTEVDSRSLLFRFGNRFVFHVDDSAILEIKYDPGSDGGSSGDDNPDTVGDQMTNDSPPPKRHRSDDDGSPRAGNLCVIAKQLPPSLTISFGSCTFRVFSFDCGIIETAAAAETTRPSSRVWGTLAKPAETVEDRLVNARNFLIQQFEIDNRERKHRRDAAVSSWRMAPPGSGLAFHYWPESFQGSFHSNTQTYKSSCFVEEDWSCCLGGKLGTTESASDASSPQKSSSPSKSGSSSTNFEHGQKEQAQLMNGSETGNSGKHQNDEERGVCHQTSYLLHGSKNNDDDGYGGELSKIQSSSPRMPGNNDREDDTNNKECNTENGRRNNHSDLNDYNKNKAEEEEIDMENEGANKQLWKDKICNKYYLFRSSAVQMELANPAAVSSPHPGNISAVAHNITSCAESLSSSYLSIEEFKERSRQFEDDIGHATSEMEMVLEKMFPARGRKSSAAPIGQSTDLVRKIAELMSSRKEAVAAKLALLMIPKR